MTAKIVAPHRGLLKLVPIPGKGRGIVTTRRIRRGALVEAAPVIPMKDKDLPPRKSVLSQYPFQWPDGDFVQAFVLGYVGLINHSATPNCRCEYDIPNEVMRVFALKTIEPGTELTWDYGIDPWFDVTE